MQKVSIFSKFQVLRTYRRAPGGILIEPEPLKILPDSILQHQIGARGSQNRFLGDLGAYLGAQNGAEITKIS